MVVNIIGASGEREEPNYLAGSTGNAALMAFTRALGTTAPRDGLLGQTQRPFTHLGDLRVAVVTVEPFGHGFARQVCFGVAPVQAQAFPATIGQPINGGIIVKCFPSAEGPSMLASVTPASPKDRGLFPVPVVQSFGVPPTFALGQRSQLGVRAQNDAASE